MTDALIKSRQVAAHRMIQRWGDIGYLVRDGAQRAATMARMEYSIRERGLYADKTARMRISVIGLAVPPDHEQDKIIYLGVHYNILLPVEGPRVTNEFIFYDCNVIETLDEGA